MKKDNKIFHILNYMIIGIWNNNGVQIPQPNGNAPNMMALPIRDSAVS